jgi:hypothetical protein
MEVLEMREVFFEAHKRDDLQVFGSPHASLAG